MKLKLITLLQKFLSISEKISPYLFLLVVNLVYLTINKRVLIRLEKKTNSYYAYDKDLQKKHFFLIASRATGFIRGLERRFLGMAKNYMIDDLDYNDGDIVVDVGANIGDIKGFTDLLKKEIHYYGFEPSANEFNILKKNCGDGKAVNKGCWYEEGVLKFFVSSESCDSSFEEPSSQIESIEEVKVIRLDEFFNENIKLVKMDGEGCELEILQGCENIFSRIEYISVDAGYERGKENLCTFTEVSNYLYSNGFILQNFQAKSRVVGLFRNHNL